MWQFSWRAHSSILLQNCLEPDSKCNEFVKKKNCTFVVILYQNNALALKFAIVFYVIYFDMSRDISCPLRGFDIFPGG